MLLTPTFNKTMGIGITDTPFSKSKLDSGSRRKQVILLFSPGFKQALEGVDHPLFVFYPAQQCHAGKSAYNVEH